jgi:hypothetical protein
MNWALTLGRTSFAMALGVVVGAAAAVVGVEAAASRDCVVEAPVVVARAAAEDPVTIVDVSRSALSRSGASGAASLVVLLGIRPDEPVVTIDGAAAVHGVDDLGAAWDRARPGGFIDVELGGPRAASGRRVLVLVHP